SPCSSKLSPHNLVQDLLSRSDDFLWGVATNGLSLRLLRDSVLLSRQAYVEFDLFNMMEAEAYSDFHLLFLLCHQSRVEVPAGHGPQSCWLEKWHNAAARQGVRVLDQLRNGVQKAIETLGGGFLAHKANEALRDKLRSGALAKLDYYRQVLRLIYRLMFVFVVEDRQLLFAPDVPPETRQLHADHYSTRRLRAMASKIRGTRHPDLWRGLKLVLAGMHGGCPQLGLTALGGFLFSPEATPELNQVELANVDLLEAIRALAYTVDRNVLKPVDYRHLGAEELGGVYESLLEMRPEIHLQATSPEDRFKLTVAAGSERKTSGSYYTPTSLINSLLDSALEPLIDEAAQKPNPARALLELAVLDPACGAGHFLIAAAHRIAKRLARILAGDEEPTPALGQHALREVIRRSLYGVDLNPMAAELCKVNLWLEAMEPGKALTFLDHHIKCGNSLLGATPAQIKRGIQDEAFTPLEGDDKKLCTTYRNRNKKERKNRGSEFLFALDGTTWQQINNLQDKFTTINDIDDSTFDGAQQKETMYSHLINSKEYKNQKLIYDAFYTAYVIEKQQVNDTCFPITQAVFDRIKYNPDSINQSLREMINRTATEYQFFHIHLEFLFRFTIKNDIDIHDDEITGWNGGFDCILGNPPWEKIKFQDKEFFSQHDTEIANAKNTSIRKLLINNLKNTNKYLYNLYKKEKYHKEAISRLMRVSNRYPLCARGDLNTYSVFTELKRSLLTQSGRIGCIVPSGIATDDTTKFFFQDIIQSKSLVSLYDFDNSKAIFIAIHRSSKFCLLTLTNPEKPHENPEFVFFAHEIEDIADPERRFTLSSEDIALLNPNTHTCPTFRSRKDAELAKYIYRRVPVFIRESHDDQPEENPWGVKFQSMFHMSNDSALFRTHAQLELDNWRLDGNIFERDDKRYLPLYEGKLFHQYDHRYATFVTNEQSADETQNIPDDLKKNPAMVIQPRYWVSEEEVKQWFNNSISSLSGFMPRSVSQSVSQKASPYYVNLSNLSLDSGLQRHNKYNKRTDSNFYSYSDIRTWPYSLNVNTIKPVQIVFRDIARSIDTRTIIVDLIPFSPIANTVSILKIIINS
ncbi:MAG: N-6 DNA methylase, partial [Deltaproteobacteria bacterium]|nr:N-6 DNA methylase [Deltaproteobacteria bacterium]